MEINVIAGKRGGFKMRETYEVEEKGLLLWGISSFLPFLAKSLMCKVHLDIPFYFNQGFNFFLPNE